MHELVIFTIGLFVGSFLNSVICRLEKGEGFFFGRSYCPDCGHKLGIFDLVPVLSFIFLRGRCRYCRKKISFEYPLVEIITGALFTLGYFKFSPNLPFTIYYLLFTSFLIVIFIYDLKHYIIPDKIIYPAIAAAIIWQFISVLRALPFMPYTLYSILYTLCAALGAAGFFAIIHFASRGKWMGFGDVKLVFLIGLLLGWPGILIAIFSACFFGAVVGTALIAFKRKKWKSEVPFGPFLIAGLFVAFFFGQQLIDWYANLVIGV